MRDEKHIIDLIENLFTCLFCIDILVAIITDIIFKHSNLSTITKPAKNLAGFDLVSATHLPTGVGHVGLSDVFLRYEYR